MSAKTKLELTWIGKENRPKLEPRFFNAQDDIDRRREQLIAEIEGKFQQLYRKGSSFLFVGV